MKKRIYLSGFIAIIHMVSLYAMEIDIKKQELTHQSSIGLTGTIAHYIANQQQALKYVSFNSYSLQEMSTYFRDMSDEDKYNTIRHMPVHVCASEILSFLYGIVMILPPEIIENHICLLMMEGKNQPELDEKQINEQKEIVKNSAKKFYMLPFLHAFDIYHEIKIAQVDDAQSIGSLYLRYLKEHDLIRELQNISSVVTQSQISMWNKKSNLLNDDLKKTFLQCKKENRKKRYVYILPSCTELLAIGVMSLLMGVVTYRVIFIVGEIFGL